MEIFHYLKMELSTKHLNTSVGDEGGFAPNLRSNQEALDLLTESIIQSNYKPGEEVFFTLDVASSEFYIKEKQTYEIDSENRNLTSDQMIDWYKKLCSNYPIVSIEDGLDENDWKGWQNLYNELGKDIQLVGDDLTVTNPIRLQKAISTNAINAISVSYTHLTLPTNREV